MTTEYENFILERVSLELEKNLETNQTIYVRLYDEQRLGLGIENRVIYPTKKNDYGNIVIATYEIGKVIRFELEYHKYAQTLGDLLLYKSNKLVASST